MACLTWCATLVKRSRVEGRIEDDFSYHAILQELDILRRRSRRLILLNTNTTPLSYFQNVIIAVYSFFIMAGISGSHRLQTSHLYRELMTDASVGEYWQLNILAEVITLLQFSFCAGVLCISSALIAPFGRDDCNIDVLEVVKRHLGLAYLVVDELHALIPEMTMGSEPSDSHIWSDSSLFSEPASEFRKRFSSNDENITLSMAPHSSVSSKANPDEFFQKKRKDSIERLRSYRKMN